MELNPFSNYKLPDKKKAPPHPRAFWQQELATLTGRTFKSILGQTKEMTEKEIHAIYDTAKSWKTNPGALASKLLKAKFKEIAKQKEDGKIR